MPEPEKVQELLTHNRKATYHRTDSKEPSLLTGLLFDPKGHPFSPSHTRKKNRRYRYYVNQALIQFKQIPTDAVTRIPAHTLESLVEQDFRKILTDKAKLISILKSFKLSALEQKSAIKEAKRLASAWEDTDITKSIELYNRVIDNITLSRTLLTICYSASSIANLLLDHIDIEEASSFQSQITVELKRCGVETKLIVDSELSQENLNPHADSLKAIQKAVRQGLIWNQELLTGKAESATAIAENIKVTDRYVQQCIKLAFLSPELIKRIFRGDIPHDMTLTKLKEGIPYDWGEQEFLFA